VLISFFHFIGVSFDAKEYGKNTPLCQDNFDNEKAVQVLRYSGIIAGGKADIFREIFC